VKNIARPIHIWRWGPDATSPAAKGPDLTKFPPLPDKPSIAVLPFDNMSGDPEQEYFADGITEDIITALSHFHWFFVIARNSSFSYKGTSPDVRQVATELGVRYVLEGSVRKGGNRVRITAQLIDATTGRHVWAERYDRDLSDIFAVQDQVTEAITAAVAPSFVAAEARRASTEFAENLDSWALTVRGNWHLWRFRREDFAEARSLFRQAAERDPKNSLALSGLALAYVLEAGAGWAEDVAESRELARCAANRAVELNDQDAWAHCVVGWVAHLSRNNEAAIRASQKALKLNPNLAYGEGILAIAHAHLGNEAEANRHFDNAVRLSPRDPSLPFWTLARLIAALIAGRMEDYLAQSKELTESIPSFAPGWRHLVVANATLGRTEAAKAALEQLLQLAPGDTLTSVEKSVPIVDPKARMIYLDALRKSGLPE
jgi:adenylate cyclase